MIKFLKHRLSFGISAPVALPLDVYAELIDGLYAPLASLVVSAGCAMLVGALVTWRTGSISLAICAIAMSLISIARVMLALTYRTRIAKQAGDIGALRRWELRYGIGAWAYAASLGALSIVAYLWTDDAVSHLLVNATTTGYTAAVTARNSGRPRIALGQLALTLLPVTLGTALRGEPAYFVLSLITALYFVATVEISLFLAANTLRLLLTTREKSELAQSLAAQNLRFDGALTNMSHGLCMFDAEARLVVSNARMCELYGIAPDALTPGMTVKDIVEKSIAVGNHPGSDAAEMAAAYEERLTSGVQTHSNIRLSSGRIISLTQRPMAGGGAVVLFEDVTERERTQARVQHLSTHDDLTDLPNRVMFGQLLNDAIKTGRRYDQQFCIMFLDLDRFKFVNDTLGHAAGDILLKEIAARLRECLRDSDVVARLGGDEFVILLRQTADPQQIGVMARKILSSVVKPITIHGQECRVTASIGISVFPVDAQDEQTLTRNADAAMYLAKEEGRNGFRFFSPDIKTQSIERLMLETSLRRALEQREFVLHYQAKRDLTTGDISGIEALLRWNHPDLGLLLPAQFIPLAEETGLIVPIGRWVLNTACAQNVAWQQHGLPPVRIAVNLSPRQFNDETLLSTIEDALAKSGLAPEFLELEITESMVMQNVDRAVKSLTELRKMGIHLAIDDFGTGYSSMSLIKKFPVDSIKIDRSFIRDVLSGADDKAITEAIITLGKVLNLNIVAEGVETKEQEAFLRDHACNEIQGFLFSRPIPADDFTAFMAEHNVAQLKAQTAQMPQRLLPPGATKLAKLGG